jgi:hypothetical protein
VQDIAAAFMQPMEPLATYHAERPLYQMPIGANFEREWVKGAKALLRDRMTRPPDGVTLDPSNPVDEWEAAEARTLDLVDWEKDIVMCTL